MPKQNRSAVFITSKTLRGLASRIQSIVRGSSKEDAVGNALLLNRLTSYASIVTKKKIKCQWGDHHGTDLANTITLNPYDPDSGASAIDRKIVVDAALEHELRCHWQYTPRSIYETVMEIAEGRSDISQNDYWRNSYRSRRLHAISHIFNLLEDGRTETRVRWEQPALYEIIAAADLIRPRWKMPTGYRPAKKAYAIQSSKLKKHQVIKCQLCGQKDTLEGIECETCFTERYRWEQITGTLLLAAIPPHAPPVEIVESEVKGVFQKCLPWLAQILRGSCKDCMNFSVEILKILIDNGVVPPNPQSNHLSVNKATGHSSAQDSQMSEQIAEQAGLVDKRSKSSNDSSNKKTKNEHDDPSKGGETQETKNRDDTRKANKVSGQAGIEKQQEDENNPAENQRDRHFHDLSNLADQDLKNFDFQIDLDIGKVRQEAQNLIESIQFDEDKQKAHALIMGISGAGAGPGIDRNIRRVQPNQNLYEILRTRNLELGRHFAREIDDLVHSLSRPQRYQRVGRLDRKQLVNAVARGKNTVFIRPKIEYRLDFAAIISVDLSGSMAKFNRSISSLENYRPTPAQLADAVTTLSIGFDRLKMPYEIRAFGSYQWLARGFYDHSPHGIGGIAGLDNGGTDMTPAVEYANIAMLGRSEKDRLIVILTDGWPNDQTGTAKQIREARLQGFQVLGILFDNQAENRNNLNFAMSRLFGSNGFAVIHSLDEFPQIVGHAIKDIVRRGFVLVKE